jgi:hypothetical protein
MKTRTERMIRKGTTMSRRTDCVPEMKSKIEDMVAATGLSGSKWIARALRLRARPLLR